MSEKIKSAEEMIFKLIHKKSEENNTVDLNAYALGLQDMYAQFQQTVVSDEIKCPFCEIGDFDRIGLKYHLEIYCEAYKITNHK